MTSTELQRAAVTLASKVYKAGIEKEHSDPFSLVVEPETSLSSTMSQFTPWQALPEEFSLAPSSTDYEGTFSLPGQQIPSDLQSFALQTSPFPTWNGQRSDFHTLEFLNPNGPFGMANLGNDIGPLASIDSDAGRSEYEKSAWMDTTPFDSRE
jgi:hypothetical protein